MSDSAPAQFRDLWYKYAPPWLSTDNAERYMYSIEFCRDVLLDKMDQAIRIRMPGQGDLSQLPYLANDRAIVQGPAETDAAFIIRLQTAIHDWHLSGSRRSILQQLQAYASNLQPGVSSTLPEMAIVGGSYSTVSTWDTIYNGDSIGAVPTHSMQMPSVWNWDGKSYTWRAWLILYMHIVTVLSGTGASTTTAAPGSLLGQNVNGVWVPGTSGTAVNNPWLTITGLSGLTSANAGQWLTLSGSTHAGNNGTFFIASVSSATTCVIANPNGVASDTGPLTWSIGEYPWIGPGPAWGSPGYVFGQGQAAFPPIDTGSLSGGVWKPSVSEIGFAPSFSWGLDVSSLVITSIRNILKSRKSAATYYPNFIVVFGAGEYLPSGTNPTGQFGSFGSNVNGVWTATPRTINSPYDCHTQGTGIAQQCTVENVT